MASLFVNLDDDLHRRLKEIAGEKRMPLYELVWRLLRAGVRDVGWIKVRPVQLQGERRAERARRSTEGGRGATAGEPDRAR